MSIKSRITTMAVTVGVLGAVVPVGVANAATIAPPAPVPIAVSVPSSVQASFDTGIQAGVNGYQAGLQAALGGWQAGTQAAIGGWQAGMAGAQAGINAGAAALGLPVVG
jgi:hypothetical protein